MFLQILSAETLEGEWKQIFNHSAWYKQVKKKINVIYIQSVPTNHAC